MSPKEQLIYAIEECYYNRYRIDEFAKWYSIIYDIELNYDELSNDERILYKELNIITGRYSKFKEDHIKYPKVFYNDNDVKKKVNEVYEMLYKNRKIESLKKFDKVRAVRDINDYVKKDCLGKIINNENSKYQVEFYDNNNLIDVLVVKHDEVELV